MSLEHYKIQTTNTGEEAIVRAARIEAISQQGQISKIRVEIRENIDTSPGQASRLVCLFTTTCHNVT